jgi:hypothetical protein
VEAAQPIVELTKHRLTPESVASAELIAGGDAGLDPGHSAGRPAIKLVLLLSDEHHRPIDCSQHLSLCALLSVIPDLQGVRVRRHSNRSRCNGKGPNRDMRSRARIEAETRNESTTDRPRARLRLPRLDRVAIPVTRIASLTPTAPEEQIGATQNPLCCRICARPLSFSAGGTCR